MQNAPSSPRTIRVRLLKSPLDYLRLALRIMFWCALLYIAVAAFESDGFTDKGEVVFLDSDFEEVSEADIGVDDIVVGLVDLHGVIMSFAGDDMLSGAESTVTPDDVRDALSVMRGVSDLSGLVVRFETPGGEVTASDEIRNILATYKAREKMPLFFYSGFVLASGGYYAACAADKVFAAKNAEVGSIGVIIEMLNYQKLAKDTLGVDMKVYKTGEFKDMGNPFREPTPAETALLNRDVRESMDDFVAEVAKSRDIPVNVVRDTLGTGQVWTGKRAKELGLVDDVFYPEELGARLKAELGAKGEVFYASYRRPEDFLHSLESHIQTALAAVFPKLPFPAARKGFHSPRLYYLLPW
ncbi:signal peptide peptidase SppA [Desulfolutivibrio sulfoxidireducens]|uniref:signal peptide peptidase SppA n=1 Tax=Desulfolutivibrio sulfoxidireducens TaxID=2773299 RepID=UPI00159E9ED1|nr:signal peptide peptidase SppA [Desulfolutivibrio sulfoxidireducens]QLA16718.1 signal peptide peptidase SppA [Desulfolutivibrio sulfoxidireducens]